MGRGPVALVVGPCLAGLSAVGALAGCDVGRRVLPPLPQPTAAPVEEPSDAPAPAQSGLLPATAVGHVPLSLDEINRLAGKGLFKSGDQGLSAPMEAKGSVKPPECQPLLHALHTKAATGSAFTSFQFVVYPASDGSNGVFEEAVMVYPALDPAKTVFQKLAAAVGACGGKSVDEQQDGADQPVTYHIEAEPSEQGKLRWTETEKGQSGDDSCVFEARMIENLLFDVVECGPDAGDLAARAADMMAARAV
ncbi:sensor domain-containing protein [Segniliparus rugosus]|nr:sensor domain-containing protein [Segniliparus rugosus]